jgi:hypothetical protein
LVNHFYLNPMGGQKQTAMGFPNFMREGFKLSKEQRSGRLLMLLPGNF